MARYGLMGARTRDFLTFGGRVLFHDNRAELEFLIPGTRVLELPPSIPSDQTLPVRLHPDLVTVRWPLDPKDFRR